MAKKFILRWHEGYTAVIRRETIIVSDEDAWMLRNRRYRVDYKSGTKVPVGVSYSLDSGNERHVLSREIMNAHGDEMVLFKNLNALDNRRSNLVLVKKYDRGIGRKYRPKETTLS